MDPRAASEADARLNLGAVYTALLTLTPEQDERHLPSPAGRGAGGEGRRLSALELLNRYPRLVLLGDPGSGKSTFVNFVALCLGGEALAHPDANLKLMTAPLPEEKDREREKEKEKPQPQPWGHGVLLPLRVVLRDFAVRGLPPAGERATAKHLWDFISDELRAATLGEYVEVQQKELLSQGGLLLLDGLDEVPEADQRRAQIKQAVEDFAATFRKCRVLVTSRTYAYQKQDWRLNGFEVAVLAPFTEAQIRAFAEHWYAHIAPLRNLSAEAAQGGAALLQRAIFNSARLRELAERPLLLTLMASLHAWRGGSLPEKREELYADAVDLLLDQWERPKTVRDAHGREQRQPSLAEWLKADRDQVRSLLNELAYRAHATQPAQQTGTADLLESELVAGLLRLRRPDAKVDVAELVDYLSQRAGLLLPRGTGIYTFPHRTFQEYLAACYLTDHDYPDQIAGLARADLNRWREVALLAGAKAARGSASTIWQLAEALSFREPEGAETQDEDAVGALLSAQALVETANLQQVSERHQRKVGHTRRWLVRLVEGDDLPALERARAGDLLATVGDPRPGVAPTTLSELTRMEFCFVPPGPFVMGSDDVDDEKPKHKNDELTYGYWLARYPVTNAQFTTFVQASGYSERRYWPEAEKANYWKAGKFKGRYDSEPRSGPLNFGAPFNLSNHPVVGVSWYEALAFCRWLTEKFRAQLTPGYNLVLPSEAEWEKAARGGAQIPHTPLKRELAQGLSMSDSPTLAPNPLPERVYPWGNDFDSNRTNTSETEIGTTCATGCLQSGASPYGALDLSGNVFEWTRSLWGEDFSTPKFKYPYHSKDGREDLKAPDKIQRALRGGSFYNVAGFARCAFRYRNFPYLRNSLVGFRIVASPFRL